MLLCKMKPYTSNFSFHLLVTVSPHHSKFQNNSNQHDHDDNSSKWGLIPGDREIFKGLNENWDPKLLHGEKMFPIGSSLFSLWLIKCWKSKIRFFLFFNPMNGAQRICQPHCSLLSCVRLVKYLYLQLFFIVQQGHTHF